MALHTPDRRDLKQPPVYIDIHTLDIQTIIDIDQHLLLAFNGSDSLFLDGVVTTLTDGLVWIPLYLSLFYLVVKNNETMLQIFLCVAGAAFCVLLADGMADGIIKPLVGRLRPSVDPATKYLVDIVNGYRDSGFSFFSAHAANTMSIAVFFSMVVHSRRFSVMFILWSLLIGWTRIYLGVHFPLDVFVGHLWGAVAGFVGYFAYIRLYTHFSPRIKYISSQYTSTGYDFSDISVVQVIMVFTFVYALLHSIVMA